MNSDFQNQLKERLEATHAISYKEICEIIDAFQISSGQGFAINKTKVLLNYLKVGNSFTIENFQTLNNNKRVSSVNELVEIFKSLDRFVDLSVDKDFKQYFL